MTNTFFLKSIRVSMLSRWSVRLLRFGSALCFIGCCMLCVRIGFAAYALKAAQCAAFFVLSFLPRLFGLEARFSSAFFAFFLLFAGLAGSVFELFSKLNAYDVLTHLMSGILCSVLIYDYCNTHALLPKKSSFVFISLCFILAVAAVWEMYEFVVFSMLKNTSLSLPAMYAEFGIGAASQVSVATVRNNFALSAGTIAGLLKNQYDTFCDVLCAALAGSVCTAVLAKHFVPKEESH